MSDALPWIKTRGSPWTAYRVQLLKQWWAAGLGSREVARRLNGVVSPKGVATKAATLGLKHGQAVAPKLRPIDEALSLGCCNT